MKFYVYELQDEKGKAFYVGKGSGRRMHEHEIKARYGCRSKRAKKIRQIWARGGQIQKVKVFETDSETTAFDYEIFLIDLYGREKLTNATDGGDGPSNPSPEVRKKMSEAKRKRVVTEVTRAKHRARMLGHVPSQQTRDRIAAAQRKIKKPWAVAGAIERLQKAGGFKGRKWSDEHRRKFREARLGHPVSKETRDKISKSKQGTIPWNKKQK